MHNNSFIATVSCLIFFEVTLQESWYFRLLVAIYSKNQKTKIWDEEDIKIWILKASSLSGQKERQILSGLYTSKKSIYEHFEALETPDLKKIKTLTSLVISRTLIRNFLRKGRVTFKMLFCHGGISASCIPHTFKAISSEFLFATNTCKLNIFMVIFYIKDLSRNGRNTDTVH